MAATPDLDSARRLLSCAAQHPGCTGRKLAQLSRIPVGTAAAILRKLAADGQVVVVRAGSSHLHFIDAEAAVDWLDDLPPLDKPLRRVFQAACRLRSQADIVGYLTGIGVPANTARHQLMQLVERGYLRRVRNGQATEYYPHVGPSDISKRSK